MSGKNKGGNGRRPKPLSDSGENEPPSDHDYKFSPVNNQLRSLPKGSQYFGLVDPDPEERMNLLAKGGLNLSDDENDQT